jgi:hypothetical protein
MIKQASAVAFLVLEAAKQAFQLYIDQKLHRFDPLCGDTSCQLRAIQLLQLKVDSTERQHKMIQAIDKLKENLALCAVKPIRKELAMSDYFSMLGTSESLSNKLNPSSLELKPPDPFLILSYLLTQTRDDENRSSTNAKNLVRFLPDATAKAISVKTRKLIISLAKERLAAISIQYLGMLIKPMKNKALQTLCAMTLPACGEVQSSPCFFNIQAILRSLKEKEEHIALKIDRKLTSNEKLSSITLFFQGRGAHFVPYNPKDGFRVMVFESECIAEHTEEEQEYLKRLFPPQSSCNRLEELLLANAALHPQYAGESKNKPIPLFEGIHEILNSETVNDELLKKADALCKPLTLDSVKEAYLEMERMKKIGLEQGMCEENPSLFLIKHIYVDTTQHLLGEENHG